MKRKSPYLMIATLFCVLFFSACQKDAGLLPQDNGANNIVDPVDPLDLGILVPLAGNGYITKPVTGGTEKITTSGLTNWTNSSAITSTYFRMGNTGLLFVGINASVPSGTSTIKVTVNGQVFTVDVTGSANKRYRVGIVNITAPGYVKVDLQGISNSNNSNFANISDIIIYGTPTTSNLTYANDAANYNASRAGAGVSLIYNTNGQNAEWFYNEITVPTGADNLGTNYISNGFDAGYAGLQLTSSGEKRITFLVSDRSTDVANLVRKGTTAIVDASVNTGKSVYLPFDWKSGTTYKFLTQAKNDGNGNTTFSAWVYTPEDNQWKVIASCSRANSGNYLTGLYSSLQGLNADNGYAGRRVRSYNQWINTSNNWTEVTSATFGGDATATNNQRLDYDASVEYSAFYLKSQGFFPNSVALNSKLSRTATANQPTVDLVSLP